MGLDNHEAVRADSPLRTGPCTWRLATPAARETLHLISTALIDMLRTDRRWSLSPDAAGDGQATISAPASFTMKEKTCLHQLPAELFGSPAPP
jgi:hypothetical protein